VLVQHFLERSAERYPDKTALVCGGQRLTYAQVDEHSNRLAHALIDGGVQRGDRVAIYLPNSVEAVVAIFAVLKAGAAFVVVNATTKRDKLAYVLGNCRAAALVTAARHAGLVALAPDLPALQLAILCGASACQAGAWRSQEDDGSPGSRSLRPSGGSLALQSVPTRSRPPPAPPPGGGTRKLRARHRRLLWNARLQPGSSEVGQRARLEPGVPSAIERRRTIPRRAHAPPPSPAALPRKERTCGFRQRTPSCAAPSPVSPCAT